MKIVLHGNSRIPNDVVLQGYFDKSPIRWVTVEIRDPTGNIIATAEVQQKELRAAAEII